MDIDLPGNLVAAIDNYRSRTKRHMTREEAVRRIIEDWATEKNYLLEHNADGTRPEDLSSANDG